MTIMYEMSSIFVVSTKHILRSERQISDKLAISSSIENNLYEHETKDAAEPRAKRRKSNDNTLNICIMGQKQYMQQTVSPL